MSALTTRPAPRIAQVAWTLLASILVTLALSPSARAGDQPTTTDPALAGVGWLAIQVETDPTLFGGTLADSILAFAGVGAGQDAAATALANLEAGLDAYISPSGTQRPGETAKALLAVLVQGGEPTSFGGHDLEAELRAMLITDPGPDEGGFGSTSPIDQAYAILALARTSGGIPASAVTWLTARQCPSGEFQWDASCPAGPGMEDADTTAVALQALLSAGESTSSAAAVGWLLTTQDAGGGFLSFGTPNAGSSGLAAQALRAAGETAAANEAVAFITSLQFGCDADPAEIGAFSWAVGIPGFLIFTAPSAMMAYGAPRLDLLSTDGAVPEAPVLDCPQAPASTPAPTATVSPTSSPGAGELPDTAAGREPDGVIWLVAGIGVMAIGAVRWNRRRVGRRAA